MNAFKSWEFSTIALHNPDRFILLSGEQEVAIIEPRRFRDMENEAVLSVIEAAPELLAALEAVTAALGLVDDFGTATGENPDMQNRALDAAIEAMAKAKGTK